MMMLFAQEVGGDAGGITEHPLQFSPFTVRHRCPEDRRKCRKGFVFCDAYRSCHNDCSVISSAKVEKPVVMSKYFWVKTMYLST